MMWLPIGWAFIGMACMIYSIRALQHATKMLKQATEMFNNSSTAWKRASAERAETIRLLDEWTKLQEKHLNG